MRHKLLADYLEEIERALSEISEAYIENYVEEILTPERANLRIRLRFADNRLLEINEAVAVENNALVTLGYRYHCQDGSNRLIFRYDDTPHFPNLPSFPHHKHLSNGAITASKPTVLQVLREGREFGK